MPPLSGKPTRGPSMLITLWRWEGGCSGHAVSQWLEFELQDPSHPITAQGFLNPLSRGRVNPLAKSPQVTQVGLRWPPLCKEEGNTQSSNTALGRVRQVRPPGRVPAFKWHLLSGLCKYCLLLSGHFHPSVDSPVCGHLGLQASFLQTVLGAYLYPQDMIHLSLGFWLQICLPRLAPLASKILRDVFKKQMVVTDPRWREGKA